MLSGLQALREGAWSLDDLVEQANRLLPDVLPKDATGRAAEAVNQRLVRHYATQGLVDEPLKEGREARYLYRHLLQLLVLRRLLAEGLASALAAKVMQGRSDEELERLLAGDLAVQLVPRRTPDDERAEFLRRVRERAGLDPAPGGGLSTPEAAASGLPAPAPSAAQPPAPPSLARTPVAAPWSWPSQGARGRAQRRAPTEDLLEPAGDAPAPIDGRHANPAERETPQGSTVQTETLTPAVLASPQTAAPFRESSWTRLEIMDGLELMVRDDYQPPTTRLGDEQLLQLLKIALLHLEQKRRGTT